MILPMSCKLLDLLNQSVEMSNIGRRSLLWRESRRAGLLRRSETALVRGRVTDKALEAAWAV